MSRADLARLQRWMAGIVADPRGVDAAVDATTIEPESVVRGGRGMSARERLEVYRDAYFTRLPDAIREDYPGVAHALGGDRFDGVLRDYLVAHPSRHPNLIFAGRALPDHLRTRDDLPGADFAVELARLEWAIVEAFHAEHAEPLDVSALEHWTEDDWARRGLVVHPSLQILAFAYPVHEYLLAVTRGEAPAPPGHAVQHLAVHRNGFRPWRTPLSDAALGVLTAIRDGAPLAAALASADEDSPVADWFRDWTASGMFVGTR